MNPNFDTGMVRTVKAAVVRRGLQRTFASRLDRARYKAQKLIIVSPWVTHQDTRTSPLIHIMKIINDRQIPTYVFMRPPSNYSEISTLEMLETYPSLEILFNQNLHAKFYVCIAPYPYGFAIVGSANLTTKSEELYEIGLMILAEGGGEEIVKELASFALDYLRTRPDSEVRKKLSLRR